MHQNFIRNSTIKQGSAFLSKKGAFYVLRDLQDFFLSFASKATLYEIKILMFNNTTEINTVCIQPPSTRWSFASEYHSSLIPFPIDSPGSIDQQKCINTRPRWLIPCITRTDTINANCQLAYKLKMYLNYLSGFL